MRHSGHYPKYWYLHSYWLIMTRTYPLLIPSRDDLWGKEQASKSSTWNNFQGILFNEELVYYGVKLHALVLRREGKIPFPDSLMFTPTEDNDLTTFKQFLDDHICNTRIFWDKIYSDFEYLSNNKKQRKNIEMLTSVKAVKGYSEQERQSPRPIMTCSSQPFPRPDNP